MAIDQRRREWHLGLYLPFVPEVGMYFGTLAAAAAVVATVAEEQELTGPASHTQ